MTDDVDLVLGTSFIQSRFDPADQWLACGLVDDLCMGGFHPFAFTSGQDNRLYTWFDKGSGKGGSSIYFEITTAIRTSRSA